MKVEESRQEDKFRQTLWRAATIPRRRSGSQFRKMVWGNLSFLADTCLNSVHVDEVLQICLSPLLRSFCKKITESCLKDGLWRP